MTTQTVIDIKSWRVSSTKAPPKSFQKLVEDVKSQDTNPGQPSKNFKDRMKPVGKKDVKQFLSQFNFKPKSTDLEKILKKEPNIYKLEVKFEKIETDTGYQSIIIPPAGKS